MNPPAPETPEDRVTPTMFPPPHLVLTNALYAHGWQSAGPQPSALITGLTSITFNAPVGELAVRIEAVGTAAMLTLTGNAPHGPGTGGNSSRACWRAVGPVLPADVLETIARAGKDAHRNPEDDTEIDELIADLESRGWIHTEEHSHDELLGSQLADPDGAVRITWGPDEDEFQITDRRTHTTITADYTTPPSVLRAMAGIDTPAHETPAQAAAAMRNAEVLRRAREFGEAAQRFNEALPTTTAPGGTASVTEVSAGKAPLAERERDELLHLLADAANYISHAATYIRATTAAHGGDPDGVAEALTPVKSLLCHAASALRGAIPVPDEPSADGPRATH